MAEKSTPRAAKAGGNRGKKTPDTAPVASPVASRILMLAALLALGIGIGLGGGMMIESRNNSQTGGGDQLNSQIAAFIANNPALILDSVRQYSANQQNQEREQAFNLVRANDGDTVFGNPDGDVTIYEFSDYNCGYCKRSFNALRQLAAEDGNIRIVIKEFPILAQSSMDAAVLALAAGSLGVFEEFHIGLMQWQGGLDSQAFEIIAANAGVSMEDLVQAQKNIDIDAIINANLAAAERLKITGTPAFLIGDMLIPGAISLDEMKDAVRQTRENQKG